MIKHSQYFTDSKIAELVISTIADKEPNKILELGIGDGALSMIALQKWSNAHIYAADIDEDICTTLQSNKITIKHIDVLSNADIFEEGSFDIALCNPPFHSLKQTEIFIGYLKKASLFRSMKLKRISADIIFIARNLIMLKDDGILALILPDGILTRFDLQDFRADLLDNYSIEHVIQLPQKSFKKTEAQTHIVIIKKTKTSNSKIPVSIADNNCEILNTIYISKIDARYRMDFIFNNLYKRHSILEESIDNMSISRGRYTYHDLRTMGKPYVHSRGFMHGEKLMVNNYDNQMNANKSIAHEGDILMVRVGSRCLGRVQHLQKGHIYISDCIYKISVPKKFQNRLFEFLCCAEIQEHLQTLAHGVCAKVISKGDLECLISQIFFKKLAK